MAFHKGKSGNPNGRPKRGDSLTDILRELGNTQDVNYNGEPIERKRAIAEAIWKKAISEGDFQSIKFLYDRLDGLPVAKQEITGADGEPFIPEEITIRILK
jgi:hypothetical protein